MGKITSSFLSILSGVVLSLPFFEGRLWFFSWVAFLPLFSALQKKSKLQAFLLSYLTGLIFWALTIYWLVHVTLLGQILLILYLAIYFGIFGLFISRQLFFVHRPSSIVSDVGLLFIPSLWVVLEYLRAHLLTGFGWALLGYSQYLNLPIIQIADLFGVYGVSFLVMMVNVGLWQIIKIRNQQPVIRNQKSKLFYSPCFVFCVLSLGLFLSYGYYKLYRTRPVHRNYSEDGNRASGSAIKVSVIQGNISQDLKWASGSQAFILDRYIRLTKEAALDRPDLIIWPEASNPGFFGDESDAWINENIFNLIKEIKIPLLIGSVVRGEGKYFNSALLINEFGLTGRYDKLHLVPFGEYIPLKGAFKFLETIVPIGDFTAGDSYTLFPLSAFRFPLSAKFGALICFEDSIPALSREFARKGADFLVNITNDGWFKETTAPYQHLSASVFRAIENRLPLVRSANTGVSCFIDSHGRVTSRLIQNGKDIFVPGIKTQDIVLNPKAKSFYQGIGDIFVLGCFALICFCGIMSKINSNIKLTHQN